MDFKQCSALLYKGMHSEEMKKKWIQNFPYGIQVENEKPKNEGFNVATVFAGFFFPPKSLKYSH